MEILPSQSEVFLLADTDRRVTPDGPALIGRNGNRREIPQKVAEAMEFVEAAMQAGFAVQITALRHELPIDEAADAVSLGRDELRLLVSQGEIPFRSSEYVDWVRLADVLALSARLDADREKMLQSFAEEEPWDDDGSPSNG
ncbi:hypothetical protein [Kribbella sp. CA-293567]|uniref:hypothetical protein n=1 Tax=Kribbella sp. CA-293567 TaxID=3002436 RepID=UPI0022DE1CA2|nr:hypothetical protein [Kribbella sp. CA-293567]WBQ01831.1 hypothetical protein OX958_17690 [Kribbella sp. CA-293567]